VKDQGSTGFVVRNAKSCIMVRRREEWDERKHNRVMGLNNPEKSAIFR
jgi:hypothetical protein